MSSGHVIGNGGSGGNGHEEHSQLRAFLDCSAEEHGVRISDALRLESFRSETAHVFPCSKHSKPSMDVYGILWFCLVSLLVSFLFSWVF